MKKSPLDILSLFPVRKTLKQKKAFREWVTEYFQALGYECNLEKTGLMGRNVIVGDPQQAKHLITAHYDTCAGSLLPNFITPCNIWIYLLYQILITGVLILPAFLSAAIVFLITKQLDMAMSVALIILFATMLLVLYGPANRHNSNDNTSGVVTVLEIAGSLPDAYRSDVCFVLFDLEESGLLGSSSYRANHKKESNRQMVWNFDCVGDGNEILFFPSRRVKKNPAMMDILRKCAVSNGDKRIAIHEKGFHFYPSDQVNFPYGIGIAACNQGKVGLYIDKIHTAKDTVLQEDNVSLLRQALLAAIACNEEE